ncbi:polysaccharide lyase family 8 super-sandwich domain-containing protein, partial [Nonomuraea sp. NPDC004297]
MAACCASSPATPASASLPTFPATPSAHRIGHYEHGNGENLRGWHTGSGMLYWWAEGH